MDCWTTPKQQASLLTSRRSGCSTRSRRSVARRRDGSFWAIFFSEGLSFSDAKVTPAMWLKADELSDPVATWKDSYQNELLASQANPAIVTATDSPFLRTVQFGPITPLRSATPEKQLATAQGP